MRKFFSQFACRSACLLGSAYAFLAAFLLVVVWASTGPLFNFSETWQLFINTTTTIITFLSVFLIQNSQNRESKAMQLKLDELIRTIKEARNEMIDVESLSEEELERLERQFKHYRGLCAAKKSPAAKQEGQSDEQQPLAGKLEHLAGRK